MIEILDEASQLRAYARALEEAFAERELRAANEQLKSLDQLKDDFMSSVTHELRTPLTSIRALSELMLDDPDMDPPQRQQFLRIIVAETERLTRLVNQVLDMAKIESGHAEWHTPTSTCARWSPTRCSATAELFRERGAAVALDLPDAVPPLRADPDRLTQVHAQPAVQRRQVRAGAQAAGSTSRLRAARATGSPSRSATTAPACRPPSRPRSSRSSARAATR